MPIKPKTPAEQRAERAAELDWMAQMQAAHEAERAEREAQHALDVQRILAGRQAREAAIERGEEPPKPAPIKTLDALYGEDMAAKQAAEAEAERARIAAIPIRDTWFSMLDFAEKRRVEAWEGVNKGQRYPIPLSQLNAIKAARAEQETH